MRFDDHRGMLPQLVTVSENGLRATLARTKTTGAGKRHEQLELVVDSEAFFIGRNWLHTGWQLWDKHDQPRDFFSWGSRQ